MKFYLSTLIIALFVAFALATSSTPQNPIVVSYPKDTPQAIIDEAMDAIRAAVRTFAWCSRGVGTDLSQGGVITHEYSLIKGFAAKVNAKMVETVQTLGADHDVLIEKDQEITINS